MTKAAPVIIKFSARPSTSVKYPANMFFVFQYSDMNDEMRTEAMELCVTACEKFSANNEVCWAYSLSGWLLVALG